MGRCAPKSQIPKFQIPKNSGRFAPSFLGFGFLKFGIFLGFGISLFGICGGTAAASATAAAPFTADPAVIAALPAPADSARWSAPRPLFAPDLADAACKPGSWAWRDDILTATGADTIWTRDAYADFALSLEFRCAAAGADSGLFIRCPDPRDPDQTALEIKILQGDAPGGNPRALVGAIYSAAAPSRQVEITPGKWHQLIVEAAGPRITVYIDGERLLTADLDRWTTPAKNPDGTANKFKRPLRDFSRTGQIGLARSRQVAYRHLFIEPLPPSPPVAAPPVAMPNAAVAPNAATLVAYVTSTPWTARIFGGTPSTFKFNRDFTYDEILQTKQKRGSWRPGAANTIIATTPEKNTLTFTADPARRLLHRRGTDSYTPVNPAALREAPAAGPSATPGTGLTPRPLFAPDLSNAVCQPGSWAWNDGILASTGAGMIWTLDTYADFILSLEFRCERNADGGLFIRCANPGDPVQTALEIQILQGDAPGGNPRALVGAIYSAAAPSRQVEITPGKWHQLIVGAAGSRITVYIDKKRILDADLDRWTTPLLNPDGTSNKFKRPLRDFPRSGQIGLARTKQVTYRNLFIAPAPAKEAAASLGQTDGVPPSAATAAAAEPFANVTYLPTTAAAAETEDWTSQVPVITVPAATGIPSDATVLFDGTGLDAWDSASAKEDRPLWKIDAGVLTPIDKVGNLRTKTAHGDVQIHLEFRAQTDPEKSGQSRGNSGLIFMGLYEFQLLDSYENPTYVNGQAASVYKQHPPLVNPSRPPGEWQTFDVIFIAPRFAADGALLSPARITAFHNGVLVQHDAVLTGPTMHRGRLAYTPHPARLPLMLQNHPVDRPSFRNIWLRDLAPPPSAR
jgi:hypothetical protein